MKITLLGEAKSTNHIYKHRVIGNFASVYMSKEGKDIKESYQWQCKSQYKGLPTDATVHLSIRLYFGDKRKRDIDNYNKIVLDACTGILWVDDSQIQKLTIEKYYCKENPRVELDFDVLSD